MLTRQLTPKRLADHLQHSSYRQEYIRRIVHPQDNARKFKFAKFVSMGSKPEESGSFNNLVERYEARSGGHSRGLARYLLQLPEAQGITEENAYVLDNACGTGIVTDEILSLARSSGQQATPRFHLADVSPNMVQMARSKLDSLNVSDRATVSTSPGEALDLPSDTFTHSITNCGILFFKDPQSGAREIHRTLHPNGTAFITTWQKFSFFDTVVFPAQKKIRPDDEPFPRPMKQPWYDPAYLEKVLREAGFRDVQTKIKTVTFGAKSEEEVAAMLADQLEFFVGDKWTAEEKGRFREVVGRHVKTQAEARTLADGSEGVGFPAHGIIAICKK